MTTLDTAQAHFVSRFGDCESRLADSGPDWLAPIRRTAIERFAELGFPTRRNEAWKYTSVAEIAKASLDPEPPARDGVSSDDIRALLGSEASQEWFVFEDGRKYTDFKKGDKIAKYGLTGLVLGGGLAVAAKTGLLQKLMKPILIGQVDIADDHVERRFPHQFKRFAAGGSGFGSVTALAEKVGHRRQNVHVVIDNQQRTLILFLHQISLLFQRLAPSVRFVVLSIETNLTDDWFVNPLAINTVAPPCVASFRNATIHFQRSSRSEFGRNQQKLG